MVDKGVFKKFNMDLVRDANYDKTGDLPYYLYMQEEIKRYLRRSQVAPTTKELYEHYLNEFDLWLTEKGLDWKEIDDEAALDFLDSHPKWSESSRYSCSFALRGFYKWVFGAEHPINTIRVKRHDPGPQRTLDWDGLEKLLASIDTSKPNGVRNLAIISLMVDTGLRASEVARLEVRHMNMKTRKIDVIIKGGEWEKAVFFDYTASLMEKWLAVREKIALPSTMTVFCGVKGIHPGCPMTKDGLRKVFRDMSFNADMGLISPHDMRRTFATLASKSGAPSRVIQVAGRWKNIKMVERYTQALEADDLAPFSPINKLMGVVNN